MSAPRTVATFDLAPHNYSPQPRKKKPFITNIEPRTTANLTPRATKLLLSLMGMADGDTGELKIPKNWNRAEPYWYTGKDIEKRANMSKPTRLLAMNELKAAGFVTMKRTQVWRQIDGRLRAVAGHMEYTLHRQPKMPQIPAKSSKVKVESDLQKSTFSTVKEVDQQIIQEHQSSAAGCFSGVVELNPGGAPRHHHHQKNEDEDDARATSQPARHVNPAGKSPVDEWKSLPPALRAWADSRILGRAQDVRSTSAYLRKSRPAFLENWTEEVELFLVEQAKEFMCRRLKKKLAVPFLEVCDLLHERATEYDLPLPPPGDERYDFNSRIFNAAANILGLAYGDGDEAEEA